MSALDMSVIDLEQRQTEQDKRYQYGERNRMVKALRHKYFFRKNISNKTNGKQELAKSFSHTLLFL